MTSMMSLLGILLLAVGGADRGPVPETLTTTIVKRSDPAPVQLLRSDDPLQNRDAGKSLRLVAVVLDEDSDGDPGDGNASGTTADAPIFPPQRVSPPLAHPTVSGSLPIRRPLSRAALLIRDRDADRDAPAASRPPFALRPAAEVPLDVEIVAF